MTYVYVGMGTCGMAAGADKVYNFISRQLEKREIPAVIKKVGCFGLCTQEVMVDIKKPGFPRVSFAEVNIERANEILDVFVEHEALPDGYVLGALPMTEPKNYHWPKNLKSIKEHPIMRKQQRIVLRNCGVIDPESLEEYVVRGGYQALSKVLSSMKPDEVIETVIDSGLRGRGGGGFPTGKKWLFTKQAEGDRKFIICNADEGDPGAFMDRSVLEGDPHSVIEGMIIAAYAIGANEGYIYVRAEYPLAIKRIKKAISDLEANGMLGENILGSGFNFDLKVKMGAGAFVCGEETALIASIEGKRGAPRPRPPYPATYGLWGCPTNINNVETFANVAMIIDKGSNWFKQIGTARSPGTKVFAVTGKTRNSGLIEVPMGISLREIIFELGGGLPNNKRFKAAQIGGPSGGCLPAELLDTPIDYDSLQKVGAMMGSGGLVVMDEDTCMVDVARFFLNFTKNESCGKCIPCREGTARLLEILEVIVNSDRVGTEESALKRYQTITQLERLSNVIKDTAACGLGQTAPNPILSTMKYFKDEYRAHVFEQKCPAKQCRGLLVYRIEPTLCRGCGICAKKCPQGAIVGERKHNHYIVADKCLRCGACVEFCPFDAITVS
ncbi:MAG TPA: NADH-quinone oxidoreductase subunit NuoF [Firmicutes bacterium]|nr:NADH-quinone oxidoreductase subunit NuoF [Bacillota bacterium]